MSTSLELALFWLLGAAAAVISGRRISVYIRCILKGRGHLPGAAPLKRLKIFAAHVAGQWPNLRTAAMTDLAGPGHVLIFWGAGLAALYYLVFIFVGDGLLMSGTVREAWAGRMLLAMTDLAFPLLCLGMVAAALRRSLVRPDRLGPEFDARLFWCLTGLVLVLTACYFVRETLGPFLGAMPNRGGVANGLARYWAAVFPAETGLGKGLYDAVFWIQYSLLLILMVYAVYSNHRHPLFSPFNIYFQSFSPLGEIPLVDFSKQGAVGAACARDLTRKQLLEGFACTHCGRCQENCPAWDTQKPLSPKQLILAVNHQLLGNMETHGALPDRPAGLSVETLLSCTTCGACIQACPVSNRPMDTIVEFRRHLVYEGIFDPGQATALTRLARDANPWGARWHKRAPHMDLDLATPGEHYEYIYWLGCAAGFDGRARQVAEAMAGVLKKAGIRTAFLGTSERCCGDAARRMGDEGRFQILARENIRELKKYDFNAILTHCPHCLNALGRDYKAMGAAYKVVHHTTLLHELIQSNTLRLHPAKGRIIYHDPCYLGRYNQIYQPPRQVLNAMFPDVSEFGRNQSRSYCCGAGGGHMWKTSEEGRRISVSRVNQALAAAPDFIASACPHCLLMLDEAVQTADTRARVIDVAEAVHMYS